MSLEKIEGTDAEIAVLSMPDAVKVALDGQEKGMTPFYLKDAAIGEHDISISSPGYKGRTVRAQTLSGYKLSVNFQLAIADSEIPSSSSAVLTPSPQITGTNDMEKPYVIIKDTPTGFLRVRNNSSSAGIEVAQVKPGDKYPFLEAKDTWFKISYEKDKEGWISEKYAEKVE